MDLHSTGVSERQQPQARLRAFALIMLTLASSVSGLAQQGQQTLKDNQDIQNVKRDKEGSPLPYDKTSLDGSGPGRGNFEVRMGAAGAWPCQKPPWGRLTAVNAHTGDIAWQVPLGITEGLPEAKQRTGRPGAFAGPGSAGGPKAPQGSV